MRFLAPTLALALATLAAGAVAACGGRTIGTIASSSSSSQCEPAYCVNATCLDNCGDPCPSACTGSSGTISIGSGTGTGGGGSTGTTGITTTFTGSSAMICIDLVLQPGDLDCASNADCASANAGQFCGGSCLCGGTAANTTAAARLDDEIMSSGLDVGECACPELGVPTCAAGQCILCQFGEDSTNPACNQGETDGGVIINPPPEDASTGNCVEIDVADYETSCTQASDCISINTGDVCSGQCGCGGTAVNVSGQARYEQAITGITFEGCPCASQPLSCVAGQCAFGSL